MEDSKRCTSPCSAVPQRFMQEGTESCNMPAVGAAPMSLIQRLFAAADLSNAKNAAIITVLGTVALLSLAEPSTAAEHAPAPVIGDLAENEEFWSNVLRYVSYFFSVLLGTAYTALKPIAELLKRPTTAALVLVGGAALYFFVSTTVSAMLGMNDIIDYEPSSIVTPMQ